MKRRIRLIIAACVLLSALLPVTALGGNSLRAQNQTAALLGYLKEAAPRYLIGADPFDTEALVHRMMHGDFGRPGEVAMSCIAILETACWDIKGKALNQPVHRLLGGKVATFDMRVPKRVYMRVPGQDLQGSPPGETD